MNEQLKNLLLEGKVNLSFEKADGSMREMNATINTDFIPEHAWSDGAQRNDRSSDEVQVVWDLDKEDWRSFRWDRLKTFQSA